MKRYKIQTNYNLNCSAKMTESDGGEWVRYSDYRKEKEDNLSCKDCKCQDDENVKVPLKLLMQADQMLFLVGQHGSVVLDDELKQQMINVASQLRKVFMNMKGE